MASTVEERANELNEKWTEQAEQAVQAADVAKLRHLVDEACKNNKNLAKAFDGMILVYAGCDKERTARVAESDSAIAAMRDVALAAIELCKATQSR